MDLTLKIWRQANERTKGSFATYMVTNISPDSSFFEMLDSLNQQIISEGNDPVAFDHDCREGICGTCSLYINGRPHGPKNGITSCQLHMRSFNHGDTIVIEPWRAKAFPVIKDLIVDRSSFDKIIQSGGYISANVGAVADANAILIAKEMADLAMDAASCIGCGACVAACGNASAMLFAGAKVAQLAYLPQGQIEAKERVKKMVSEMDKLGFGNCSNMYACEAECPKEISVAHIAKMNRQFFVSKLISAKATGKTGGF